MPVSSGAAADEYGEDLYLAGTSGSVSVPSGGRVLGICAYAGTGGASVIINGGAAIPIPASTPFEYEPRGRLIAPTIVFDSTVSYVVEYVI
jgi:hypothetical protein